MAKYQVLNHLGEITHESLTAEQFEKLVSDNPDMGFFQFDANPENDLVEKWKAAAAEGAVVEHMKIFKLIEE